jgi:hypothetical protein
MRNTLKSVFTALAVFASSAFITIPVMAQNITWQPQSVEEVGGVLGGLSVTLVLVICCALCLGFIVPLILAILVYRDATKNMVENAALWAIIAFIFNIVGTLIYFFLIRPEAIKKNQTQVPPTAK